MEDFRKLLVRMGPDHFESLLFPPYRISIQAGLSLYCTPRETLADTYQYTAMEVAIFKGSEWVMPTDLLGYTSWVSYFDGMSGSGQAVAAYVPIEVIQQIVEDIAALAGGYTGALEVSRDVPAKTTGPQPLTTRPHRRVVLKKS